MRNQLPAKFDKNERKYQLVARTEQVAFYSMRLFDAVRYEVWIRKEAEEATGCIAGRSFTTPARELVPTNSSFGHWAWVYCTRQKAAKKYEELTALYAEKSASAGK